MQRLGELIADLLRDLRQQNRAAKAIAALIVLFLCGPKGWGIAIAIARNGPVSLTGAVLAIVLAALSWHARQLFREIRHEFKEFTNSLERGEIASWPSTLVATAMATTIIFFVIKFSFN